MGWGGRLDCEVNGAGAAAHGENFVLATGNIGKVGGTACILGSAINSEISASTTLPVGIAEHRDHPLGPVSVGHRCGGAAGQGREAHADDHHGDNGLRTLHYWIVSGHDTTHKRQDVPLLTTRHQLPEGGTANGTDPGPLHPTADSAGAVSDGTRLR